MLCKGILRQRRNAPIVLFPGQGKSGFEVGTCVFHVAEIPHRDAPFVERLRVLRPQPDRLVVIPDGSRAIAEGKFRFAPVAERLRELRPQPDRLVAIPEGSLVIAEGIFRVAPVAERLRELRPQPDRLVAIPDGSRVIAEVKFRVAPVRASTPPDPAAAAGSPRRNPAP